jgi:hypothetical protein
VSLADAPVAAAPVRRSARRTARAVILGVCALTVAVLGTVLVRQSWTANTADATTVAAERAGVAVLRPLTVLLGRLVDAQSSAVRGEGVDTTAVRDALAGLAEADRQYDTVLRTHRRIVDLTNQVEAALAAGDTGRAGYDTYSTVVTLAVALERRVTDSSRLVLDPDLDSSYLVDVATVRLPDAVVAAGRAADLVALGGDRPPSGEDAVRAAVARHDVSAAADAVSDDITQSVTVTSSTSLGMNLTQPLDIFRAATDAFAPPTVLQRFSIAVSGDTVVTNAHRIHMAAITFADKAFGELDTLLVARGRALTAARGRLLAAAGGAAVAGLVMVWLVALPRPRGRSGRDAG